MIPCGFTMGDTLMGPGTANTKLVDWIRADLTGFWNEQVWITHENVTSSCFCKAFVWFIDLTVDEGNAWPTKAYRTTMVFTEHSFRQVCFQPSSTQLTNFFYGRPIKTQTLICHISWNIVSDVLVLWSVLHGQHHTRLTDEQFRSQNARFPEPCAAQNRTHLAVTGPGWLQAVA